MRIYLIVLTKAILTYFVLFSSSFNYDVDVILTPFTCIAPMTCYALFWGFDATTPKVYGYSLYALLIVIHILYAAIILTLLFGLFAPSVRKVGYVLSCSALLLTIVSTVKSFKSAC